MGPLRHKKAPEPGWVLRLVMNPLRPDIGLLGPASTPQSLGAACGLKMRRTFLFLFVHSVSEFRVLQKIMAQIRSVFDVSGGGPWAPETSPTLIWPNTRATCLDVP